MICGDCFWPINQCGCELLAALREGHGASCEPPDEQKPGRCFCRQISSKDLGVSNTETRGEQLDWISRDLDATTSAWVTAGRPRVGPEFDAREAAFNRLHKWLAAVRGDPS